MAAVCAVLLVAVCIWSVTTAQSDINNLCVHPGYTSINQTYYNENGYINITERMQFDAFKEWAYMSSDGAYKLNGFGSKIFWPMTIPNVTFETNATVGKDIKNDAPLIVFEMKITERGHYGAVQQREIYFYVLETRNTVVRKNITKDERKKILSKTCASHSKSGNIDDFAGECDQSAEEHLNYICTTYCRECLS